MAKPTLQARYIAALMARGYVELTARRYVGCKAFKHPAKPTVWFVGNGGSLRAGQNRVTSTPVMARTKAELLSELPQ